MKRLFCALIGISLLCSQAYAQTVGLVLSGGGAKGIAHIGLIQLLEENNIPIDYIAGTSMGAIVGALYAMGYTPQEMLSLIKSKEFQSWQTGKIDEKYIYYFKKPEPTPAITSFKIAIGDSSKLTPHFLPNSLINPLPMNYAFMELFGPYTAVADKDFNNLLIPFRAVASDVYHKKPIILDKGDLGDAVRASMTYPFVFKPIEIDGVLVYDGGIYNNFPVDVMKKDFNPDIIIGSVVSGNPEKPEENNLMTQIENMVMQKTDYTMDEKDGILLNFDLKDVSLLDFQKAEAIAKLGYDEAKLMLDSIKKRIPREYTQEQRAVQRQVFKSKVPKLQFEKIEVEGGNHAQRAYVKKQFEVNKSRNNILENDKAQEAYFKILSDSKISDLIPHAVLNDSTENFTLNLKAKMSDNIGANIGGYISSTSANLIYVGFNYRTLGFYSADFDISGEFGRIYNSGMTSARIEIPSSIPMYLKLMYVFSDQKYFESEKLFYSGDSPTFINQMESFCKLHWGLPFLTNAKTEVSVGYGYLYDRYYRSNIVDYTVTKADKSRYHLLMGSLKFDKNTLDNYMYPISGNKISLEGKVVVGKERFRPFNPDNASDNKDINHSWIELSGETEHYFKLARRLTLGLKSNIVISSKGFFNNYTSTLIQAPAFTPTPHSKTVFNEAFRATQYAAVGILPIWKIMNNFYLRTEFYGFVPFYKIYRGENNKPYYGKFLRSFNYLGEISVNYQLPFASVSLYVNKYSYPKNNWNFGISLGTLIYNPKFLR